MRCSAVESWRAVRHGAHPLQFRLLRGLPEVMPVSCTRETRELSCEDSRHGCAGKASQKVWVKLQPLWAGSPGEATGESWGTGRDAPRWGDVRGWVVPSSDSQSPQWESRGVRAHTHVVYELTHTCTSSHAHGVRAHTHRALKPGPSTAWTLECPWDFPFMFSFPILLHFLTNAAHCPLN